MRLELLGALALLVVASTSEAAPVKTKANSNANSRATPKAAATARAAAEQRLRQWAQHEGLDQAVALLAELIPFATVSEQDDAQTRAHFQAMGAWLEAFAKREGLQFRAAAEQGVFELGWGEGAPNVAFVLHGDVVPAAGSGWTVPPFQLTRKDGKLYGRGSEDDKGPMAATLAIIAAAKRAGLTPIGRHLIIVGMGEEHDWRPMRRYAEALEASGLPRSVISVDSGFPVTASEFGYVAWSLVFTRQQQPLSAPATVVTASAGEFLSQVPAHAALTLEARDDDALPLISRDLETAVSALANTRPGARYAVKRVDDTLQISVTATGESTHASVPEHGKNALWDLAALTAELARLGNLGPSAPTDALLSIAQRFDGDHLGEKLGLAYSHPEMGALVVAPTLLRMDGSRAVLGVNLRRPAGKSAEAFAKSLDAALARFDAPVREDLRERSISDAHIADSNGPLVRTLLDIYEAERKTTGAKADTIRGGTYARLFPGAVNFGPSLPGEPYMGHTADEYLSEATLSALLRMYTEALLRLNR